MIIRRLARPMLAGVFVCEGVNTLRHPDPRVRVAAPLIDQGVRQFGAVLPKTVPTDAATLVKLDAAVKIAAGAGLAFGVFPRLSALVLAGSMVPTTLAGHAFWAHEDPTARATHRTQFLKNLGLVGGLLIAALDNGGRPSRAWRARQSAEAAAKLTARR